jgi:hypothetical protein
MFWRGGSEQGAVQSHDPFTCRPVEHVHRPVPALPGLSFGTRTPDIKSPSHPLDGMIWLIKMADK